MCLPFVLNICAHICIYIYMYIYTYIFIYTWSLIILSCLVLRLAWLSYLSCSSDVCVCVCLGVLLVDLYVAVYV